MSSGGIIRLSDPALNAQLAALTSQQTTLTGNQNTLQTNLAALVTQVGALAPSNVIENGEFTAAAILSLLLTVDGTGSGLDADTLDGKHWTDVLAAIAAGDADTVDGKHWSDIQAAINAVSPMSTIAGQGVGAVGTFANLRYSSNYGSNHTPGKTQSGNVLRYSDSVATSGNVPSGTWRLFGHIGAWNASSVWLRIY